MSEPSKDKELTSDAKGKAKVETADHNDKTSSTDTSTDEEITRAWANKKCKDAMDFFTEKAKGIVIGEPKAAGKRRKRAQGGMKRSISLISGLSEIGMSFDSDSKPTNADVVVKIEQKDEEDQVQEEISDVFEGSDTDSDEVCKRMKKGSDNDDDDGGSGAGAGAGAGAHIDLSGLGLQVAGN